MMSLSLNVAVGLVVVLLFLHNQVLQQLPSLTRLDFLEHILHTLAHHSLSLEILVEGRILGFVRLVSEGRHGLVWVPLFEARVAQLEGLVLLKIYLRICRCFRILFEVELRWTAITLVGCLEHCLSFRSLT